VLDRLHRLGGASPPNNREVGHFDASVPSVFVAAHTELDARMPAAMIVGGSVAQIANGTAAALAARQEDNDFAGLDVLERQVVFPRPGIPRIAARVAFPFGLV